MNKKHKLIIIAGVIVMILAGLATLSIFFMIDNKMKKKITAYAEQNEYQLEFKNSWEFSLKDKETIYFFTNRLGKIVLNKIYTEVPSKADYKVIDDKGEITVTVVGKDKLKVELENGVIDENGQGREIVFYEHVYFVCSSEFTMESIDKKNIITIRGKADKYYNKVTKDFISSEELRNMYKTGVKMTEELMM